MLSSSENILNSLTRKSSFHDVETAELEQLAKQYPYFGAVQYLLAKKLYLENKEEYKTVAQKAALHFVNPVWLHFNFAEVHRGEEEIVNNQISLEQQETSTENEGVVDDFPEADSAANEKLSSLLKEQAEAFEKPVEETSTLGLETLPYHRVDYFDSQGIKLDAEKDASDKLGVQLKRFTDWLKQMKRINLNPTDLGTDQKAESEVQNLAEHSNEREEVVTEAMAEVLIKQGKPEQAIYIYEKLSFLNPSKSAYFAEKIGDLKA
jgi:hypothetical protein